MSAALTAANILALPAVVDVPTAGRCYGIGERHAYELVRRGEFPVPVQRLGRLLRVRRAHLVADLGLTETSPVPAGASVALAAVQ